MREKVKRKTEHQRLSARLRQKERRHVKQAAKLQRLNELDIDPSDNRDDVRCFSLDSEDSEFTTCLILLTILYDADARLRTSIQPVHAELVGGLSFKMSAAIHMYMNPTKAETNSPETMASYLSLKRSEYVSLQRQEAKIERAAKYHEDKLNDLRRTMMTKPNGNLGSLELDEREAFGQHRTVQHAKAVLPRIIASRKTAIRALERKLTTARQESLVGQVHECESWQSALFPSSPARTDLLNMLESARAKLAALQKRKAVRKPDS